MSNEPRNALIDALAGSCEAAIYESNLTAGDVIEVLCTVLAWAVANTQPKFHEDVQAHLTAAIPRVMAAAREAREHIDALQ
jgi:hypothetical protein